MPYLPARGRIFLNDHLCVQAHFMAELNRVLGGAVDAVDALPDRTRARECLLKSQRAARQMHDALRPAEHGHFQDWYAGDRLFGLNKMEASLAEAVMAMQ